MLLWLWLGTGRPHPQDLILAGLGFDEEVAGLAGGNALAGLQGLEGGEGDGDLGARLAGSEPRLVDNNLLDGGRALLESLKEKKLKKKNCFYQPTTVRLTR